MLFEPSIVISLRNKNQQNAHIYINPLAMEQDIYVNSSSSFM